ncbi:MAG: hypothetical protein H6577_10340 [Lewinellaceae bacterium]|nr:hypothetical protein [Saprospiraceae bacterium]MCB9338515.1 hypothetical protein [Lewinellaceae bacterium]
MAAKNEQHPSAQVGEISTIRNILMGQQMAAYEAHFASIGESLATMKSEFSNDLKSLGNYTDDRISNMEKDMNERFDRIEKLLSEQVKRLDEKLQETSKDDRNTLAKTLEELSRRLAKD